MRQKSDSKQEDSARVGVPTFGAHMVFIIEFLTMTLYYYESGTIEFKLVINVLVEAYEIF